MAAGVVELVPSIGFDDHFFRDLVVGAERFVLLEGVPVGDSIS